MKTVITEAYRAEQAALHAKGNYGTTGMKYGALMGALLRSTGAKSLLDYGCGSQRSLLKTLELPADTVYEGYDPAVPAYADAPLPAELVCCIDVLEHIEPALLDNVLDNLAELCDPFGFFTIHSGPAVKVLSDGRNAHLTQQGPDWWMPRLNERFEVLSLKPIPQGFCVMVKTRHATGIEFPENVTAPMDMLVAAQPAAPTKAAAGTPMTALKHGGLEMVFHTPNRMTAWRVETLFKKEPDTIRWIESMPEGSVLVDVGANVGMYTIFSAATRKATVFAFEPESQNFALLNSNIASNQLGDRVTAFPLALSDRTQADKLYLSEFEPGNSCHSIAESVGFDLKPRTVSFAQGSFSTTLDQLVDSGAVPVPDYIKLDVDGFEHKVIEGARKTLTNPKVRSVIVELNTHLAEHRGAVELLQSLGFSYDEAQVTGALRKSGTFEGVGEFIFRRAARGAAIDFQRSYSVTPPSSARGRQVLQHVLEQVAAAKVVEDPFPYVVVDQIFPADYYEEMLANFPTAESLRPLGETGRVARGAYQERLTVLFNDEEFSRMTAPQQAFWRDFASWMYTDPFLQFFLFKFQRHLEPRIQKIVAAEGRLSMKGDALLVNDQTNYAISPHTDAPHRLVSFLFYLPRDDSMRDLGTTVYRPKDPNFTCWGGPHHPFALFEPVRTLDFLPNRLVAFPKTERSFHGVEKIEREGINRPLLINNLRLLNSVTH